MVVLNNYTLQKLLVGGKNMYLFYVLLVNGNKTKKKKILQLFIKYTYRVIKIGTTYL